MEKNKLERRRRAGGFMAAGTLVVGLLAGCGSDNFSGNGNEFNVAGKVDHGGKSSITATIYAVREANGDASNWFDSGLHQMQDNCNCHGFWAGNETFGVVYNMQGNQISPHDVLAGACIDFIGKIRSNQNGKVTEQRPVYDVAREIPCPA